MQDGDSSGYQLAYQEAVRTLSQQQSVLDSLRSRAGTLLATATVATALFASGVLEKMSGYSWSAIGFFVLVGGAAFWVLLPRPGWLFDLYPSTIINGYVETTPPASLNEIYRELALYMEKHSRKNDSRLTKLSRVSMGGVALLAIELSLWIIDLAGR